ncbi:hypothetical protein MON38_16935 [Hymenobacter sp. DH14]|uniref:Uncharacterized protein n=1 Tax=Hymenobacter cyanobacteriorum TaxID=2926463 RepID=A0A9X2AGC7_9BACT|nr:hypothetical protein [Hymenobacter cyanobacteriorum]MCI1189111.1 hypothetical protein [Hymenobacter cyanobacteriorum]
MPANQPPFLDPASKIDQPTFDAYSANWLKIVSEGGEQAALDACFNMPDTGSAAVARLIAVSFTVAQIMEVLSAPGIAQVRARFVVNPEKKAPNFALVLYAVDAQGRRQTSYYLSDYQSGMEFHPPIVDVELPDTLRQHWVSNWADTKKFPLSRQLFATSYGPLQGFNFSLSDFMQPLMRISKDDENLSVLLGLHTFFGPSPDGEAVMTTFGLMVQTPVSAGTADIDDPSYDVAAPSPPAP